jgi:uncharacterized protein
VSSLIHIDERKWPERLHWQFDARYLGDDEYGVWLYAPAGTAARRGMEPPLELRHGFVVCVPEGDWWIAEFYWDHPWHEIYVNVGTPPRWEGDRMTQVDLDLDVVRKVDGSVAVLDEDEFADHQERYGYSDELVSQALAATDRAVAMLQQPAEPFAGAAAHWLALAGSS